MSEEAASGRTISMGRGGTHAAFMLLIAIAVTYLLHRFAPRDTIFHVELARRIDGAELSGMALAYFARELLDTFYPLVVRK